MGTSAQFEVAIRNDCSDATSEAAYIGGAAVAACVESVLAGGDRIDAH